MPAAPNDTDRRYIRPVEPSYALLRARVRSVAALTPRVNRIVLDAPGVVDFPFATQDQWVKVFFPLDGQRDPVVPEGEGWYQAYLAMPDDVRPPMRTYTVRDWDRGAATLTIDFVLHGDIGPATRWATRAVPGDRLAIYGPGFAYVPPDDAAWIVLLGDETSLPAVSAAIESADDRPTLGFVEVADDAECLPVEAVGGGELRYLPRNGTPSSQSTLLVDTLRAMELPEGAAYFWLAGEASKVRAMRRVLVQERGVDKRRITFIGYWREGATEDETVADDED